MKREFLKWLVCPGCGGGLQLKDVVKEEAGEIEEGTLLCNCGKSYPITRSIPRFVASDDYVGNFSFEWTIHSRTQLDTEVLKESENTFIKKTGFTPEEIEGKLVLDVGCGMGRFSDVVSKWGGTVVGVDLSYSVDSAFANIGHRGNVHIAQANVFDLPFAPGTFDYIFSIGVLHHTPDCKKSFQQLPPLLTGGGKIAIWLYYRWPNPKLPSPTSDHIRKVTTRMPLRLLYTLSYASVPLYWIYKIPYIGDFMMLLLPISRLPRWRWRVLDTFDWYSPEYQSKHTYPEVYRWFREEGLTDIELLDIPVSMQGRKV